MDWTYAARAVGAAIGDDDCRAAIQVDIDATVGGRHDLAWFRATLRGVGLDEALITTSIADALSEAPIGDLDAEELALAVHVAWSRGDHVRAGQCAEALGARTRGMDLVCTMPEPGGVRHAVSAAMGG